MSKTEIVRAVAKRIAAEKGDPILISRETGRPILPGDHVTTFRGETMVLLRACPPHKPSSTGRVIVRALGSVSRCDEFFPAVIDAEFITPPTSEEE